MPNRQLSARRDFSGQVPFRLSVRVKYFLPPVRLAVLTCHLGVGDTTDCKVPAEVPLPVEAGLSKFVQVAVTGNKAACALSDNLKAYCWGYNLFGKLGNNTANDSSDPTAVSMPTP